MRSLVFSPPALERDAFPILSTPYLRPEIVSFSLKVILCLLTLHPLKTSFTRGVYVAHLPCELSDLFRGYINFL